jgi:hypothetical protein
VAFLGADVEFNDDETRRGIEDQLDAVVATSHPVMAVLTDDTIEKCVAVRKIDERTGDLVNDWLSLFT